MKSVWIYYYPNKDSSEPVMFDNLELVRNSLQITCSRCEPRLKLELISQGPGIYAVRTASGADQGRVVQFHIHEQAIHL